MKTTTFHIVSEDIKQNCLTHIEHHVEIGHLVTIKDAKETRNAAQLRLKWLWMGFLAKELVGEGIGRNAEDWNRFFKGKFLRAILIAQDEEYAEFYRKADELIFCCSAPSNIKFAKEVLLESIKTEWLNKASMSVFMGVILLHCSMQLSVTLPVPEDLMWLYDK